MADKNAANGAGKLKLSEKATILGWYEAGVSAAEISKRLGRHKSSIFRLIQKAKGLPKFTIPQRKIGSGRAPKAPNHVLGVLQREIKKHPRMTAAELRNTIPELQAVSERTVQRYLQKKLNLPSRSAAQKPLLTKKMKKKRLQFAKNYLHFTAEDWSKVMYSDESTFRCIRSIKGKVRRLVGSDRFDSRYTIKTVKHPDSVMVWACFTGSAGRGGLFFLPKNQTMNGKRYQGVLENHLLPWMERFGATHFLQDGAPCHASKRIKQFLQQQPFQIIDWPGNSPDLNPIENCWAFMKNKLKQKDVSSVPKLIHEIKMLWVTDISQEYLKNLSDSMPGRLKMVIAAKGDMTKY